MERTNFVALSLTVSGAKVAVGAFHLFGYIALQNRIVEPWLRDRVAKRRNSHAVLLIFHAVSL